MRKWFLLLLMLSLSFAVVRYGDGTYKLYEGDSVRPGNGFEIVLDKLDYDYDSDQDIRVGDANFVFLFKGEKVLEDELDEDRELKASSPDNEDNVTLEVTKLGHDLDSDGDVRPYARVTVTSESVIYPNVTIIGVEITPGLYDAAVRWNTSIPANSTVFLFHNEVFIRTMLFYNSTANFTATLASLDSDSDYKIMLRACARTCTYANYTFRTNGVSPEISGVRAVAVADKTAVILWKTDIESDSTVFYRKAGATGWQSAPPPGKYDDFTLGRYYNIPEITMKVIEWETPLFLINLSDDETGRISTAPPSGSIVRPDYLPEIDPSLLELIIRKNHSVNLEGLQPQTAYEYKVSSCAEACSNSSVYNFTTRKTLRDPYAEMFLSSPSLNHGTSLVVTISAMSMNEGGKLMLTSLEWDDEGETKSMQPYFGGDNRSFLGESFGSNGIVSITFTDPGKHRLTLGVVDNFGRMTNVTKEVLVSERTACKDTSAKYYPSDTSCNDKWPTGGGETIDYNQEVGACDAFEVCDENLDYLAADAESCCNGQYEFSIYPEQRAYSYDKERLCDIALQDTRNKKPMSKLNAENSMKACKTSYLVRGFGSQAVYMKDYYYGEACCKDKEICGERGPRFEAGPWPRSNIQFSELWCHYTTVRPLIGSNYKVARDGWYSSDTNPRDNNNAMATVPAHASVNLLNTGTCVDYGLSVATALRKAGYKKYEIFSVEAPGHVYDLVWLPGDGKYSFIDTTGNTGGDFFTGAGGKWTYGGSKIGHCDYKSDRCANDLGFWYCPGWSEVAGC